MAISSTSFKMGNKAAQKSPKVVIKKFNEMLDLAKNDPTILCYQDALQAIGWRNSKAEYWINKLPVFVNLKKDIQNTIVSRINKNALNGTYNAAASIWRMKQLGETDVQHQNIKSDIKQESKHSVDLSNLSKETLEELKKVYDNPNPE